MNYYAFPQKAGWELVQADQLFTLATAISGLSAALWSSWLALEASLVVLSGRLEMAVASVNSRLNRLPPCLLGEGIIVRERGRQPRPVDLGG